MTEAGKDPPKFRRKKYFTGLANLGYLLAILINRALKFDKTLIPENLLINLYYNLEYIVWSIDDSGHSTSRTSGLCYHSNVPLE